VAVPTQVALLMTVLKMKTLNAASFLYPAFISEWGHISLYLIVIPFKQSRVDLEIVILNSLIDFNTSNLNYISINFLIIYPSYTFSFKQFFVEC